MNEVKNVSWPGWNVVRMIGRGSFGAVYEMQRNVFGDVERAALKVISIPRDRSDLEELLSDGYEEADITERLHGYLQDIVREYSLMAKIKGHTNVVYCDDMYYSRHQDGPGWDIFIKMELLTPLINTLDNDISEDTVVRVAMDLCNALVLCRRYNIVHRDIKPQNIFVSECGDYKLGDFGIAKTTEKTTGGTKIGTYKYMAPEVYNNQPYGLSADIYSLGMVLYWMLNGRRSPFLPQPPGAPTARQEEEARHRRFSGEPLPEPVNGSPALKAIVLKACAFNPRHRYSTPEEMLADLKRLENGQTVAGPGVETSSYKENPYTESGMWNEEDATVGFFGQNPSRGRREAAIEPRETAPNAEYGGQSYESASRSLSGETSGKRSHNVPLPSFYQRPGDAGDQMVQPPDLFGNQSSKKRWPLFAGIGGALLTLVIIAIVVFSGGSKAGSGKNINSYKGMGEDIFAGAVFEEMFYGYYEAESYYFDGKVEETEKFLKGMEFFTYYAEDRNYELGVLPLSIEGCKFYQTIEEFEYEGETYNTNTEKGREMFLKSLLQENENITEADLAEIDQLLDLNVVLVYIVDDRGESYGMTLHYTIENGKLHIYDMYVDEDYNLSLAEEPLVSLDFLFDGGKLLLQWGDVVRTYVASGYKETDPGIFFEGFTVTQGEKYQNIEGIMFEQLKDEPSEVFVILENWTMAEDPTMELDTETGFFTLSWTEIYTYRNGIEEILYEPATVTGRIIPCTGYEAPGMSGFFLFGDGECYPYLLGYDAYEEIVYGP